MGIFAGNIFGPTGSLQPGDITDSGECGHHFYYIEADRDITVAPYQQYVVHDRNKLKVSGKIRVEPNGEVLIKRS